MVNRSVTVGIRLTPYEAESELWEMDTREQVEFMMALARRYQTNLCDMLMQMQGISDEMNALLSLNERKTVVYVIERLLEYIKKDDENEYELKDLGNGCYEKVLKRKEEES